MRTPRKIMIAGLALALSAVVATGCSSTSTDTSTTDTSTTDTTQTDTQTQEQATPTTVTVTDGAGREVTIEQPVDSILTVYGSKYILALGLSDKLVNSVSGDFEQAVDPSLSEGVTFGKDQMNAETIAEIHPDVFIHSARATELLDTCQNLGIPSIGLYMETPEEVVSTLEMLGKALGVEDRASYVIEYYQNLMNTATELTKDVADADKPTAILMGNTIGKVANGGMLQSIMIETAGGVNLAKDIEGDGTWPVIGTEQIFEMDPDYIFIMNSTSRDYDADSIMADPAWANLTAVQNGHVYVVPSDLDSWEYPCVQSALGTLWMVTKMYPDKLSDADFETYVTNFYKDIFNVTLTREQLNY